ncbi:MAG: HAD-IIIC family phosphatase [Chloroflexi bacterium]|nr:MAG: HAD-IIIC family phosphatase [Chloroflexota bacterium]
MDNVDTEETLDHYLRLIRDDRSARTALMVAPRLAALQQGSPPDPHAELRFALLGSGTLDQLRDCLAVGCYRDGWRPRIHLSGFDQYAQEMLVPASALYRFDPQVLILAVHPRQLFPVLHEYPFEITVSEREMAIEAGLDTVRQLLTAFRRQSQAVVILHNMVQPQHPALGIADWRDPFGQRAIFNEINMRMARLARDEFLGVHILDADAVQARCGKSRATDVRLWLAARLPWSETMLQELTTEHMRYLGAAFGRARKCLVLDLDGTLWGGVVGEDGVEGLKLGADAPGNAYVMFQREILRLWNRGVLLAICSKNDPDQAMAAFRHPAMVLRESHFAAQRINWEPKPSNLRQIAAELDLGLDSMVFLDDNPVERAAVRAALPQVLCPDLPTDPAYYRQALVELSAFDTLAVTEEDLRRNAAYTARTHRRRLEADNSDGSVESYLSKLETRVEITAASAGVLPRLAQLTQKTNQFNLTTRRYTETEIRALQSDGAIVSALRVVDRFGDNGIVGLAIAVARSHDTWELDVLLLSCRVIGRDVESGLLSHVASAVRARGGARIQGWFLPTERNGPARDCYARHGFRLHTATTDGGELWEIGLETNPITVPSWIEMEDAAVVA